MGIRAVAWMMLVGCAGNPLAREDPHAGQFQLLFHNEAGGAVCAIHIFPEGDPTEGDSWLDPGAEVASGQSIALWMQPGTYQLRAVGCSREKLQLTGYAPQVIMNRSGVAVLYREDVPRSVEAADALAHDHANSTRIPAKLTANKGGTKTK
jgi:hypothetical protein